MTLGEIDFSLLVSISRIHRVFEFSHQTIKIAAIDCFALWTGCLPLSKWRGMKTPHTGFVGGVGVLMVS